jgi:hypothetical protein
MPINPELLKALDAKIKHSRKSNPLKGHPQEVKISLRRAQAARNSPKIDTALHAPMEAKNR